MQKETFFTFDMMNIKKLFVQIKVKELIFIYFNIKLYLHKIEV